MGDLGKTLVAFLLAWIGCLPAATGETADRRIVSLNGTWQIADGPDDPAPQRFDHAVAVPGLVDMAEPAFEEVGVAGSRAHRQAFWYRRTFTIDGPVPAVARLKVHKAKYGTRIFLNGHRVGDHLPCFTPAVVDVGQCLRGEGQTNELVIRVGAYRDAVPRSIPDGWDFEKVRYIPGIYDSVELILTGTPHVERLQAVPDVESETVRAVVTVGNHRGPADAHLALRVLEKATGRLVASEDAGPVHLDAGEEETLDAAIPIPGCRLWSPETPFLYRLEASTGSDTLGISFGMRSFRFDRVTKRALLNGKPYPLRGTNVCIYRFFEDPGRGDRPWREEWVRRLHELFRRMHWNSARYCIGFPPEMWYEVADETGMLIQDEFPIWYLGQWPEELTSEELVREYTAWLEERWNHPCVVIWDAQNETRTEETGEAIRAVRGLDLSNRPWDNGWAAPQAATDVFEAHPYPFYSAKGSGRATEFRLSDFADLPGAPGVAGGIRGNARPNQGGHPVVINEYGWLWLNRDGTPTALSEANYRALLGDQNTVARRRELYARYLAAMTEFWRCRRSVAGVMHFCGLGYSRPGGETSDHFLDLETLTLEPNFQQYVGDAFAPVGVMIDYWGQNLPPESKQQIPVVVINDLAEPWQGTVTLQLARGPKTLLTRSQPWRVPPRGLAKIVFSVPWPSDPGSYTLMAQLSGPGGRPVRSWRDLTIPAGR